MLLLSSLLEDPKVTAGAHRPDQGSRVLERPRLRRGSALIRPSTPAHSKVPRQALLSVPLLFARRAPSPQCASTAQRAPTPTPNPRPYPLYSRFCSAAPPHPPPPKPPPPPPLLSAPPLPPRPQNPRPSRQLLPYPLPLTEPRRPDRAALARTPP